MLIHGSDKEKAFDFTVQRSFPYIIFPPIGDSYNGLAYDEFRNKLINNLVALYHYKNDGNDDITFHKQNEEIRNMLESVVLDKVTSTEIETYNYQQMTVDTAIRNIVRKLSDIDILNLNVEKLNNKIRHLESRTGHLNSKPKKVVYGEGNSTEISNLVSNIDPSKSYTDIVLDYLKTSGELLSAEDIAKATNLTLDNVKNVFTRLKLNKTGYYTDILKHIKFEPGYYYPIPNSNRSYPRTLYQWDENPVHGG